MKLIHHSGNTANDVKKIWVDGTDTIWKIKHTAWWCGGAMHPDKLLFFRATAGDDEMEELEGKSTADKET